MAGPQAQRPISQHEGTSASRALRPIVQDVEQQHVEIAVDDDDDDQRTKDVERGEGKRVRHRHHHRRPLYRRLISYIRNAWTAGVNFSSSNGLVKAESSKRDALTKILDNCIKNDRSHKLLVEIMAKTDAVYFVDLLNKNSPFGSLGRHHMLRLLRHVIDNPEPSFLRLFIDVISKRSIDMATLQLLFCKAKQLVNDDTTIVRIQTVNNIDKKRKVSPVNFSLSKKIVRTIGAPIGEFTLEGDTHKKKTIPQPRPSLTDRRTESNDYSTDVESQSFHGEHKFPDNFKQKLYTIPSRNPVEKNEPNKKCKTLLLTLPNNVNASSRGAVFAGTKSHLSNTNVVSKKCTPLTRTNIVERLPPILSSSASSKSKTFPVTMPSKNLQNFPGTSQVSPTGKELLKRQMMYLFNRPCLKYLNGYDCGVTCSFNHELPPVYQIFEKMMLLDKETIMYIYSNFIATNSIAFITYFPTICDIFGSNKMESSLISAIKDCEHHDKIEFFQFIYEGLVKAESSKRNALTKIIDTCVQNTNSHNVLLEIILHTDPLHFVDILNKYFRLAPVRSHHMLTLLRHVSANPTPSLLTVYIDMLDKYSMADLCEISTFPLLFFKAKEMVKDDITMSKRLNEITFHRN